MRYDPYSNMITSGKASEIKKLRCPLCNGKLKITYIPKEHAPGLYVDCVNCKYSEHNRLVEEPKWVSELGNEFETL